MVDYDGTLTSIHKLPEFAKPSKHLSNLLKQLQDMDDVYVYVLSGRSRNYLDKWFNDLGLGLSAEHGCFYKHNKKWLNRRDVRERIRHSEKHQQTLPFFGRKSTQGWLSLIDEVESPWRDTIRPLLQYYTKRTPGSFIEEKEINMTWNYRNSDPEFGVWQASELFFDIENIITYMAISVVLGNKTVELRPSTIDKASAARAIMSDLDVDNEFDFIMYIGDGQEDEVVFSYLNDYSEDVITAIVGKKQSNGKYCIDNVKEVHKLLQSLVNKFGKNPVIIEQEKDN